MELQAFEIPKAQRVGHPSLYTLFYIEKGSCRMRINFAVYQVDRGEALLLPPGVYAEKVGDRAETRDKTVYLEGEGIPYTDIAILYPDVSGKALLSGKLHEGGEEALFRHLHTDAPDKVKGLSKNIRSYVLEKIHTKLSVHTAAIELGISPKKLGEICKEAFGCGFSEYVHTVRLTHAKHLLQNKTLKISEITERLGFTSAQYFSLCFKKATGMTPSDYRKYFKI